MKIARYCYRKKESYGVLSKQTILPLPALAKHFNEEFPEKLGIFIAESEKTVEKTERMLKKTDRRLVKKVSKPLNRVSLLPPISFPHKIICLGLNYDHATETKSSIPKEPILFLKPHTTIAGPNQAIKKPQFVKELDYEGELCIVIGKAGKNISIRDAKNRFSATQYSTMFQHGIFNSGTVSGPKEKAMTLSRPRDHG